MRLHFKHEDTRLVVAIFSAYVVVTVVAAIAVPDAAVYVAVGYVLVAVVMVQVNVYRRSRIDAEADRVHVQDLIWLHTSGAFDTPLPPLTGWAAEPGLVGTLQSIVQLRRPSLVVELGSGASTIVVAHALKRLGDGLIISLDHDETFAARTKREVERRGLGEVARVRHAPLGPV
ncbi:MAG: class I SAM-dependent methyltransferase, partial [Rhodothermales bacterium]|nr:class I SAM-dependent methyltransferase [Rhodothermales bacterium]